MRQRQALERSIGGYKKLDGNLLVIGRGDPTISDNMRGVATTVMDATARIGIARDDRPYRPHLTLARAGRPQPFG